MDSIQQYAGEVLQLFILLPLLTQWAVVILLVAGFIVHVFTFNEKTAHDAPSLFTTGGIFFTFVGIAIGLINFNSQEIEKSVPHLLQGLQTAFVASVVGVFIALTIKLRLIFFGLPKSSGAPSAAHGATVDDLFNQMVAVQQSLVGEDDSTLLSQIKLSRTDTNDRLDSLRKSQSEFMEKMADNNSKALIQALQEVIRDFNTKISEQFGENFKKLNEAVGQLLVWQERYRVQISEMVEQQSKTAQNMQVATERYSEVVAKAETFSNISRQFAVSLEELNVQRSQIEQSLKSLGELLHKASGSLPQIEAKIMELTRQMTDGVKSNRDEMTKSVRDSSVAMQTAIIDAKTLLVEATQKTNQEVRNLTQQVSNGVKNNQDEMNKTVRDSSIAMQTAITDAKNLLLEATQKTNQEVNAHVQHISEETSKQIAALDQALDRELTKAITSLGSQLTALSKQFVDDYTPLTQRLQTLVRSIGGA